MDLNLARVNSTHLKPSNNLPNGGNVIVTASNGGVGGFSSLYLQTTGETINETDQLFVGQQSGLVMMTRTAHPLKF